MNEEVELMVSKPEPEMMWPAFAEALRLLDASLQLQSDEERSSKVEDLSTLLT